MSTVHLLTLTLFVMAQHTTELCTTGGSMMIQLCGGKTVDSPIKVPPTNHSSGAKACHAVCCRKRETDDMGLGTSGDTNDG